MKKWNLAITLIAVSLVSVFLYFSQTQTDSDQPRATPCKELSDDEISTLVSAFMKKKGYENSETISIGPLNCDNGVGIRNMQAQSVIDEGLPTQHNKTIRLQMRSDADQLKIYEVVLTNPA